MSYSISVIKDKKHDGRLFIKFDNDSTGDTLLIDPVTLDKLFYMLGDYSHDWYDIAPPEEYPEGTRVLIDHIWGHRLDISWGDSIDYWCDDCPEPKTYDQHAKIGVCYLVNEYEYYSVIFREGQDCVLMIRLRDLSRGLLQKSTFEKKYAIADYKDLHYGLEEQVARIIAANEKNISWEGVEFLKR